MENGTIFEDISEKRKAILKAKEDAALELERLATEEQQLEEQEKKAKHDFIQVQLEKMVDTDELIKFFKKPYVLGEIDPKKNEVLVYVPRFKQDFQVGWLERQTETYNVFKLTQFSAWLGDVPKELLDLINFKTGPEAFVDGKILKFKPADKAEIVKRYGKHLQVPVGDDSGKIIEGREFDLLVDLVQDNRIPYTMRPIDPADMREPRSTIKPEPWQVEAVEEFGKRGAVGVFLPTGAGKSFVVLYWLDRLKGKKLILNNTLTDCEVWQEYIETYIPHAKDEIKIDTYQGYDMEDKDLTLAVYNECHTLPANTFARLATIQCKYRFGLSATPFREDGKERFIYALTGYPVGTDWNTYMKLSGRRYHPVYVHVVRDMKAKIFKMHSLIDRSKKTTIFCDGLDLGHAIARQLNAPFVNGETKNRLETIRNNRLVVVSRVGDEGVPDKELNHLIEMDFLKGSRRQELQRTGRLMHSKEDDLRHDILFTEDEFHDHGKRIFGMQSKGFSPRIVRDR